MPFDPSKPADHSPASAAEMRGQLAALHAEILDRPTFADLGAALLNTSAGSNTVAPLAATADTGYNPTQLQDVMNKLDELIAALRR